MEFQDKELRGINLRWLARWVVSLIIVVSTGTASYYGIKDEIKSQYIINNARFEKIESQYQGLKEEINQGTIDRKALRDELTSIRNYLEEILYRSKHK